MSGEYQPGGCNIGAPERRRRYLGGVLGFGVAAVIVLAAVLLGWSRWTLLATVVPLAGGFLGYFQGREAFCIGFAIAGVYNVGETVGETEAVSDAAARREDTRYAQRMIVQSILLGVIVAVVVYVVVPL